MGKYVDIPFNKVELERILKWYEVFQNETQATLLDKGLAGSIKQHLEQAE